MIHNCVILHAKIVYAASYAYIVLVS